MVIKEPRNLGQQPDLCYCETSLVLSHNPVRALAAEMVL